MTGKIFYYSSSLKRLPKGLMLIIGLILLVLIPIIIALAIVAGIITLVLKITGSLLPKGNKGKIGASGQKESYIEDIEYEEVVEENNRKSIK